SLEADRCSIPQICSRPSPVRSTRSRCRNPNLPNRVHESESLWSLCWGSGAKSELAACRSRGEPGAAGRCLTVLPIDEFAFHQDCDKAGIPCSTSPPGLGQSRDKVWRWTLGGYQPTRALRDLAIAPRLAS